MFQDRESSPPAARPHRPPGDPAAARRAGSGEETAARGDPRHGQRTDHADHVALIAGLQRQAGNGAVRRLLAPDAAERATGPSAAGTVLQRRPPPAPAPPAAPTTAGAMSRTAFEDELKRRFGVGTVRTGTFADQAVLNSRRGVQPSGRLTRAGWQAWDPGASSPVYGWIVDAFDDFAQRLGGWPPVSEIIFLDTAYDVVNRAVRPNPDAGADFGGGVMRIYRAATTKRKPLPFARSDPSGNYPGAPVLGISGVPGQSPGAPLPVPTPAEGVGRIVTHELGHGLAEQVAQAMPNFMANYRRQVGWYGNRLYDVQNPVVRSALASGSAPPATDRAGNPTEITPNNWNHPRWGEQPISHYMVKGERERRGEDFAEAVMAYVEQPGLLNQRSPARFTFISGNRDRWLPFLRTRQPKGDFPTPRGDTRHA